MGHQLAPAGRQLRCAGPGRFGSAPARRRRRRGGFLMAAVNTDRPALSGPVPPPVESRPRVMLVGTAFASVASVMVFVGLLAVYLATRIQVIGDGGPWIPEGMVVPLTQPNMMMLTMVLSVVTVQWVVVSIKNDDRTNAYLALGVSLLLA